MPAKAQEGDEKTKKPLSSSVEKDAYGHEAVTAVLRIGFREVYCCSA
jgi:hypothetical protein